MTKYFIDTEFIEDGRTIDLISIGVVCEDGREYYAISRDFNPKKANPWVKANVLNSLPPRVPLPQMSPREREESRAWKYRWEIAQELREFFLPYNEVELWGDYCNYDYVALMQTFGCLVPIWQSLSLKDKLVQTFKAMFGDLGVQRSAMEACPYGFPFYCNDVMSLAVGMGFTEKDLPQSLETDGNHHALIGARSTKERYEWLEAKRCKQESSYCSEN